MHEKRLPKLIGTCLEGIRNELVNYRKIPVTIEPSEPVAVLIRVIKK